MSFNVELKDRRAIVSIKNTDGSKEEKTIDIKDFKQAFSEKTVQSKTTPLLPGEYGTQKIVVYGNTTRVLYLEAPAVRRITYETGRCPEFHPNFYTKKEWDTRDKRDDETDEEYEAHLKNVFQEKQRRYHSRHSAYQAIFDIVTPRLLWVTDVVERQDKYVTTSSKVYAMKQSILTEKEELYETFFSNIYNGSEQICWGYNTLNIPTLKSIQGIPSLFFNAPFNSDLDYSNQLKPNSYASTFYDIGEYMTKELREGASPEDVLSTIEEYLKPKNMTFQVLSSI